MKAYTFVYIKFYIRLNYIAYKRYLEVLKACIYTLILINTEYTHRYTPFSLSPSSFSQLSPSLSPLTTHTLGHSQGREWFHGVNAESATWSAARVDPAADLSQGRRVPAEDGGVLGRGAEA